MRHASSFFLVESTSFSGGVNVNGAYMILDKTFSFMNFIVKTCRKVVAHCCRTYGNVFRRDDIFFM